LQQLSWDDVDIALIDAADERRSDDQYPGVAVVRHIRRIPGALRTSIVVLTEHYFDDALRRRMRETRADSFHDCVEVAETWALRNLVLQTGGTPRGVPRVQDIEALFCLGVTECTRVNQRWTSRASMTCRLSWRTGLTPAAATGCGYAPTSTAAPDSTLSPLTDFARTETRTCRPCRRSRASSPGRPR
jgi:hypothetical protein